MRTRHRGLRWLCGLLPLALVPCAGCSLVGFADAVSVAECFGDTVEFGEMRQHAETLCELEVKKYDYAPMEWVLSAYCFVEGWAGCSGCRNGNFHGRNFDWIDEGTVEYVIRTPRAPDADGVMRHATLGVASPINTGDDIAVRRDDPATWGILPFLVVDGINDAGLVVQSNIVPEQDYPLLSDDGTLTGTCQESDKPTLFFPLVVRTLLDYCGSVDEALKLLSERDVWGLLGLECHFLISDPKESVVVEWIDNRMVVLRGEERLTNFYIAAWRRLGQHTPHAFGIERYRYLGEGKAEVDSVGKMLAHMKKVWYSNVYRPDEEAHWESETNGDFSDEGFGDMTVFASPARRQRCFDWMHERIARLGPRASGRWITLHTSVYDLARRTLTVCVQERDKTYDFTLNREEAK